MNFRYASIPLGAVSDLFFVFEANTNMEARNRPRTQSDRVSCWNGSLGTYARMSSILADKKSEISVGMNRENTNKHKRYQEGLNGGAFRSTFRLRFVTTLAHMMLEDDTYARLRLGAT
jgi:hypothetical protein